MLIGIFSLARPRRERLSDGVQKQSRHLLDESSRTALVDHLVLNEDESITEN
ncbi:hypothetical protein DPMN_044032 [Dreissena polymorpha]|uniref:Uncharacterized protein n=1 Tax=Dreissena polymorpha TaxID=45954 RepID=A0A9D4HYD1_DREPO|nr:hypothetical protein DPMN_044032 [Dreissena polymorpha]